MKAHPRYGIALGSNLGDRPARLRQARDLLLALPESDRSTLLTGGVYETAPVDCPPDSTPFLNTAIELRIALPPLALLERTQNIERLLGRALPAARNAPRPIDIDLLYAGDLRLNHPRLVLPHPRLAERAFVLVPLADIRPDWIPPGLFLSVSELLARLPSPHALELHSPSW